MLSLYMIYVVLHPCAHAWASLQPVGKSLQENLMHSPRKEALGCVGQAVFRSLLVPDPI